MKLFFSLVMLILLGAYSQQSNARDAIIISYDSKVVLRDNIKSILTSKFNIPVSLIKTLQTDHPCKQVTSAIIQICITNQNEIHFPVLNNKILRKTFKVFMREVKI